MEIRRILIFIMALIRNGHLLSHSVSTFAHADKLEKISKMSVMEYSNSCPIQCICYNLTVDCNFSKLTNFPQNLPSFIHYLSVAGNEILTLFYNSSLENLNVLNVSSNKLKEIDQNSVLLLSQLKVLDLARNDLKLKNVENVLKIPSLVHLNLSYNKLNEMNDKIFTNLDLLSSLDVSFNDIENISSNCFWKQNNLKTLNLSSNKLSDLQHDWFMQMQNLDTLILKQNKLKILRNVVFSPLSHLETLDLSQNQIKSIGLLSFKGLTSLQHLNMSKNNIINFQTGVFKFLESLRVLDISHNPFLSIDNIFLYNYNILSLYMNNLSKFKSLTSSSLTGLNWLEYLDLSGSREFAEVNRKAFFHTKNLKKLDLSYSNLKSLKSGVFTHLIKMESIKLGGNPWNCDCYMYWLLLWLSEHSNAHIISPSETYCNTPSSLKGYVLLDALDHDMVCTNASIGYYTVKTKFKVGSSAFLECQVEGNPLPSLTWITPQKLSLHWLGQRNFSDEKKLFMQTANTPLFTAQDKSNEAEEDRFYLMPNGNLAIRKVERGDGGFYTCVASNPLNDYSISIRLTLDYDYFVQIKIISVLVGVATSFGFLLLTLISVLIQMILKHFGIKCPCRKGNASPRTQQIRKILGSMEHYKKQQLDRLRDNYNIQVQKIKDNCMLQMERLRESYSSQAERLRDIKEYGTLQIDRIRENYYFQVQRVRDYSTSQVIRLRENYMFQRNRIRKFSAHHLYKLRENYKLQQQHLNKILENLNIESCRNVCQRTDSIMLEPDICLENILVPKMPIICLPKIHTGLSIDTSENCDNSSQVSAYFTPDEAGSEVSGHESDDRESFEHTNNLENEEKADIIVKIENPEHTYTTAHIPDQASCSNAPQVPCDQKTSYETIV